jgi:hypothetical protein
MAKSLHVKYFILSKMTKQIKNAKICKILFCSFSFPFSFYFPFKKGFSGMMQKYAKMIFLNGIGHEK